MKKFNFKSFFLTMFALSSLLCAFIGFVSVFIYASIVPCLWFIPGILCISLNSGFTSYEYEYVGKHVKGELQ